MTTKPCGRFSRLKLTRLPSYAGVANSKGGFTLIRVNRVIDPTPAEASERKTFARQLQQVLTQEELSAYLAGVRKRYDVTVRNESLETK